MIITLETIKHNLQVLEEVKKEFPLLQDYIDGKVFPETVNNIGLDQIVSFINFIKENEKNGIQLVNESKITYREVKKKVAEMSYNQKSKGIFLKKKEEDFIKVFQDLKVNRRYTRSNNQSYCPGLEKTEALILNYFAQNSISVDSSFFRNSFYFTKIQKPQYFSRELRMTRDLIDQFINFAKTQDFDFRKCNIKSLISEINSRLRPMMKIDSELIVRSIREQKNFTLDNIYKVIESRVNYYGFVEIKVEDDKGVISYVPYSNFEEVSRQRDELFKELGL
jgi:hypothetical protein